MNRMSERETVVELPFAADGTGVFWVTISCRGAARGVFKHQLNALCLLKPPLNCKDPVETSIGL